MMDSQTQNEKIRFIHIADLHLDVWREKELKRLNFLAFKRIVDECIDRKINFLLISGDIFNVSIPSLNAIRFLTKQLQKLKSCNIKVFVIPGSHDLSSDENSFLYVLEDADLLTVTSKAEIQDGKISLLPTEYNEKVVIYGMLGRKRGLEKEYYKKIKDLKDIGKYREHYKIFQFHIGINEILPTSSKFSDNISIDNIPRGFDYYAGGHIHLPIIKNISDILGKKSYVVYPGPVYPTNFSELEDLKGTSYFVYVEIEKANNGWITHVHHETFKLYEVESIDINCNGLTPQQVYNKTAELLSKKEITNKIVLLKFYGVVEGLISNINFKEIEKLYNEKNPYIVKRNTFKLQSKMYEPEIKLETEKNIAEIEKELIKKIFQNIEKKYEFDPHAVSKILIDILGESKGEDETKNTYYRRVIKKCADMLLENFKNQKLFEM